MQWGKTLQLYIAQYSKSLRVLTVIQRMLVRAHCALLFFFQQFSFVGIYVFTDEDPQSEWIKRYESNRVYWF